MRCARLFVCCVAVGLLATAGSALAAAPDGGDPRDSHPAYAFTAPPEGRVVLPSEHEPVGLLLLAFPERSPELLPFVANLAAAAAPYARTLVLVDTEMAEAGLRDALALRGVPEDAVETRIAGIETIWIRDWGPRGLRRADGQLILADFRYFDDRPSDDQAPTELAEAWDLPVVRPPIDLEGGNLLSDGAGRCITTDWAVEQNEAVGVSRAVFLDALSSYMGCRTTTVVPPLAREGTGHADMFALVTGKRRVLVGQVSAHADAENARRLDAAARKLRRAGWRVSRIPMPDNRDGFIRSYTNALPLDGAVLVPIYVDDDRQEARALKVLARAFRGRKIVPVDATSIIEWEGAVHCASMTLAR